MRNNGAIEMSGSVCAAVSSGNSAAYAVRELQAVPRFYDDVAMTCGASRAWTLFHVDLRVAARQIFGGVRVSAEQHAGETCDEEPGHAFGEGHERRGPQCGG